MAAPFIPKQALKFDGELLLELQGDVSDKIARALVKDLPLSPSPVVHDNGCGYGAVTLAIIETMEGCKLTFPDNTFDLSFTTFVFTGLQDDVSAAGHILRTLKTGGTGVIAVWKDMPWHVALENAHHRFRGADEPMAPFLSKAWYKKEKVMQVTKDAGCNPSDIEFVEKAEWLDMGVDLKRWVTIAWSFLATPVGGWKQADEDNWDDAVNSITKELLEGPWHKVEGGVHKIRMVADVALMRKQK